MSLYRTFLRLIFLRYIFQGMMRLLTPLAGVWHWLSAFWRHLSHFYQHFVSNLLVGTMIAALLIACHPCRWVTELEDWAMDNMMRLNQSLPRMNPSELPFTLIDIDEASHRAWGEPFHTPRDKLADLIRFSAQAQPLAILLDIELNRHGQDPQADQALAEVLQHYDAQQPPLLLLRTFQADNRQIRPLFFASDSVGAGIHWAQPLFQRDADQHIRRWLLLRNGCQENQQSLLLPSFQLLVDALLRGQLDELSTELQQLTPPDCTQDPHPLHYRHLDTHRHGVGERLIYTQSWQREAANIVRLPAQRLAECAHLQNCDTALLHQRIVIIGSSHADANDIHQTPLGDMPGMMIILNAIQSFHHYGQTSTPPNAVKWLIEALLILLMAWAFARFNPSLGALISGVVMVLVLLPLSFYFFKFGVWVDFSVPIIGMQLHQWVAQYEAEHQQHHRLQQALAHQAVRQPSEQLELSLPAAPPPLPDSAQLPLPLKPGASDE